MNVLQTFEVHGWESAPAEHKMHLDIEEWKI